VVAADVYAVAPHVGRGGWTWYTGSAAWMYRLVLESLLGLTLEGTGLRIEPRLPEAWNGFTADYRHLDTPYHIVVHQTPRGNGEQRVTLDGRPLSSRVVPLVNDREEHQIELWIRAS
jgi:cellobiose phosphorylase